MQQILRARGLFGVAASPQFGLGLLQWYRREDGQQAFSGTKKAWSQKRLSSWEGQRKKCGISKPRVRTQCAQGALEHAHSVTKRRLWLPHLWWLSVKHIMPVLVSSYPQPLPSSGSNQCSQDPLTLRRGGG